MVTGTLPAPVGESTSAPSDVRGPIPVPVVPIVKDQPRTGPPAPGAAVVALAAVMVVSVVVVFFGLFALVLSGLQEQRSQHLLYAQFRGLLDPSSTTAPSIGGPIPVGTPIALINSPQAGLHNVVVVEGTSSATLLAGPGHRRNSPLPGQAGQSVLVGKGITAGAPFGGITRLRLGDVVTVRTGQGQFRYRVLGPLVAGSRLPTIRSDDGLLTLVTSESSGPLGHLAPGHLAYVEAGDGTDRRAEDGLAVGGPRTRRAECLAPGRAVVLGPPGRLRGLLVAVVALGHRPDLDRRGPHPLRAPVGAQQRGHAAAPQRLLTAADGNRRRGVPHPGPRPARPTKPSKIRWV